jgi:uncharacterized protein (UPF0332 family)
MNELYDKSQLNLDAATFLYQKGLYDSVCHPAYYSCLQLMKHKLIKKGLSLNEQDSLSSAKYNGNSHRCVIEEIRKRLTFSTYRDEQNYLNGVKQLKEARELSDYKDSRILPEQSDNALKWQKMFYKK